MSELKKCNYCKHPLTTENGISITGYCIVEITENDDDKTKKYYHPWCVEIEKLKKEIDTLKRINNVSENR